MKQMVTNNDIIDRYNYQHETIDNISNDSEINNYILARVYNDNNRVIIDMSDIENVKKAVAKDIRNEIEKELRKINV